MLDLPQAQRPPSMSRAVLMQPPDWRYREACQYIADDSAQMPATVPTDPFVQYAVRAVRAGKNIATRRYTATLWPHVSAAIYYGTLGKSTAITAEMETYHIHKRKATDSECVCLPCGPVVYELYGKLFFDLSGIVAIHSWIHDFLFEPERYKKNTTLLRARLLAYYGGDTMGANAAVLGHASDGAEELMNKIMSNERHKKIFEYVVKTSRIDDTNYAMIMEAAIKSMNDRTFAEHMRDRDDSGSSSLEELATHLEEGVRAFSQQELMGGEVTWQAQTDNYLQAIPNKEN